VEVAAAVAVAVAVAAAAEEEAVEVAAAAAAEEDKRAVNEEETNENKNKYYDLVENFSGRCYDPYFLFVKPCGAGGGTAQNGCACGLAAKAKRIRLT
jgi:hypothetical protein